jgi:hypothetical protein
MANPKPPLQIFKPGRHTAMSGAVLAFSESDLAASAAAYNPALFEAPIVVGHPKVDAPAYGWVKSLAFAAGGLDADPHQVDPAFAEMVSAGRFKKISAAFFAPTAPNNPAPGVYYLRHVGFLGATAPAVQGLRTPDFAFAENEEGVVEFALDPAAMADLFPVFAAPLDLPPKETSTVTPEEKAALEAENAQLKTRLADAEAATKVVQIKQVHDQNAAFADSLIAAGKLLPASLPVIVATMDLFANESPQFADGDTQKPLLDGFKAFLETLPNAIEFGEFATADQAAGSVSPVEFASPSGYSVDADALALHQKALAHQAQHKSDYLTAARAVAAQH